MVLLLLFVYMEHSKAQEAVPYRQEFLNYWNQFRIALKNNDADFLLKTIVVPFDGEGSYYNQETDINEIKANYKQIFPTYCHEMDYVRFDAILVENETAYIWLGYNFDEKQYFYCYKKLPAEEESTTPTMQEKYWFKRYPDGTFRFIRTTLDFADN